jgi:16S rRNA (uracil1498-N3)-methyltransferase
VSTAPLFLVHALPCGDTAVLDGAEGRHAATVRRLRVGEDLLLADGHGGLARAVVEGVAKDALTLRVVDRSTLPPPAPRVVLAQALVKGDRGELAVELATEAGADAVVPWRAARCVARWEAGPRGGKALARWRTTAREAAKQARRAWLPIV